MKLQDGIIDHDHPEVVKGLRRAIKNVKGSGDLKTEHIARVIGVPHDLVRHHEEEAKKNQKR